MERRNLYILISAMIIGGTIFGLEVYSFIVLDINPFEDTTVVVTIKGEGLTEELELTMSELRSSEYLQVRNKAFNFKNSVGREYMETYSGVSLWSILEVNDLLKKDPSKLTFILVAEDGYQSPKPLKLTLAQQYPEQVILAYEINGHELTDTGPVRFIIDREVIPNEVNTQYAVQKLSQIIIE